MNEERKDEIGRMFLLKQGISPEECRGLEIQELIFLIHSAKFFKEKEAFQLDDFDDKIRVFLSVVKEKINDADALYIAYETHTNYPYIDGDNRIWMFSKEAYAIEAQDYFLQQLVQLEMKKITRMQITRTFAELHVLGMEKILVDNGQYHVEIERDEMLPPPDWRGTPEINIPIINPKLQHAMIRFFQSLYSQSNYEGKKPHLQILEGLMLDEIIRAKYLVPMQMNEKEPSIPDEQGMKTLKAGTTIQFASILADDDTIWLPAFTDWIEFEKAYDKTVWGGNVARYDDLVSLSESMEGIVINLKGIAFRIHDKNKKAIQAYQTEEGESQPEGITEATRTRPEEPGEYPGKMIDAVINYMKKQKRIKKAYLEKENKRSYLIIVDFEGSKEDLFKGITEAASPYLNGMFLEVAGMAGWASKDIRPFYRRKRFGVF